MTEQKNLPEKVKAQLKQIEDSIRNQQNLANAILFGARAAMEVPDDWTFNGTAFVEPEPKKEEVK